LEKNASKIKNTNGFFNQWSNSENTKAFSKNTSADLNTLREQSHNYYGHSKVTSLDSKSLLNKKSTLNSHNLQFDLNPKTIKGEEPIQIDPHNVTFQNVKKGNANSPRFMTPREEIKEGIHSKDLFKS
jgi:hypothetical protein